MDTPTTRAPHPFERYADCTCGAITIERDERGTVRRLTHEADCEYDATPNHVKLSLSEIEDARDMIAEGLEAGVFGAGWRAELLGAAKGLVRLLASDTGRGVTCEHCHEPFVPTRSDARYCSTRCRVAAHRSRRTGTNPGTSNTKSAS